MMAGTQKRKIQEDGTRIKEKIPKLDEKAIQNNYTYLLDTIQPENLRTHMYKSDILNFDEMDTIRLLEHNDRIHAVEKIIKYVLYSGPDGLPKFIQCLRTAEYFHIAEKLEHAVSELNRPGEAVNETDEINTGQCGDKDVVRIILLGKSGAGKSSLGNSLLSEDAALAASITKVCTRKEKYINSIKSTVTVIDTPGLLDSSEESNKAEIETLLQCATLDKPGPHILLYVVNLQRFTMGDDEHFYAFQNIFAQIVFKHMIVIFTNRRSSDQTVEEMLIEDPQRLNFLVQHCDNRYRCIENTDKQSLKQRYVDNIYTLIQNTIKHQTKNERFDSMSIIIATDKFHQQFLKTLQHETGLRKENDELRTRNKELESLTMKPAKLRLEDKSSELTSQPQKSKNKRRLMGLFKRKASGNSSQNQQVTELPSTSNQVSDKLVKPEIINSGQLHEKLQINYTSIIDGIKPDLLCESLLKDNIINDIDVQYIKTIEDQNRRDLAEELIARVLHNGESVIKVFLECLPQSDQSNVADKRNQERNPRIQSKMTDYYSVIQKNYIKLLDDIDPYKLIESLVTAGVFDDNDRLELKDLQHEGKKAISRELVGMVFYCGDQNFDKFVKCLEATGHDNITRKLSECDDCGGVERERGKIPDQHYRVIQSNYIFLLNDIQPDIVIDQLFEKRILDVDDLQILQNIKNKGREHVTRKLIQILLQCGDHAFNVFITCLQITGHGKLADKLKRDEVSGELGREERMSIQDEKIIRANYVYLQENLQSRNLRSRMVQRGILSMDDEETIIMAKKNGQREGMTSLLDAWLTSGCRGGLTTFTECLREENYNGVADELDDVSGEKHHSGMKINKDGTIQPVEEYEERELTNKTINQNEMKVKDVKQEEQIFPKLSPHPVMVIDRSKPVTVYYYKQQVDEYETRLVVWKSESCEWEKTMSSWWEKEHHQPGCRSDCISAIESWLNAVREGVENIYVSWWNSVIFTCQTLISLPSDVRRFVTTDSDEELYGRIESHRSGQSRERSDLDKDWTYLKHQIYRKTGGAIGVHSRVCERRGYVSLLCTDIDSIVNLLTKTWYKCEY